jgi:membrane protein DedA with SNARE-associated domain
MFDWITGFVMRGGYVGVFLLMLAENVVPPIPSELIMPLAGFTAARGQLSFILVVIAGTVGSLLGAVFWYYVGQRLGSERLKRLAARHGRWVTLSPDDVDKADDWFRQHGTRAVFFGRLIPTVRTLISVPAGIAGMPLPRFLAWSVLGTSLWTALLAGAGYLLQSQYDRVSDYLNPVSTIVVVLIIGWYLYRVVTFRADGREQPPEAKSS